MRSRTLIGMAIAVALVCGSTACSPKAPSLQGQKPAATIGQGAATTSQARIQALTLAALSNKDAAPPRFGERIPASAYTPFLVGHISLALPGTESSKPGPRSGSIALTFDEPGTAALSSWTTAHVGEPMVVLYDGQVVSAASIGGPLQSGHLFMEFNAKSALGRELLQAAVDSQGVGK